MGYYKAILGQQLDARILANRNRGPRKWDQQSVLTRMEIFGDMELLELFEKLPETGQANVIIAAYRKSSKVMLDKMKANLTTLTKAKPSGNLYRSLGVYADKRRWTEPVLFVGARRFSPWAGFHAHLVEAGTVERGRYSKSGASTGRVKPTYFFAKAVNATKDQVIDRFQYDRLKALHDYVTKFNNKHKS